jgi:hypothetical protein
MNKQEYEIADDFCKEALLDPLRNKAPLEWLENNAALYEGISKLQNNEESNPLMLFGNKFYLQLGSFHSEYEKLLYEKNILKYMTQEEAFVYFFEKMDTYNIDKLLDVKTCQDIEKHKYMQYLHEAFEEMQMRGNTHLGVWPGICQGCKPGHKSYCFLGNKDKSHIDILIELDPKTNLITDVYECLKMDCADDFKPEYSKKIRIHAFKLK